LHGALGLTPALEAQQEVLLLLLRVLPCRHLLLLLLLQGPWLLLMCRWLLLLNLLPQLLCIWPLLAFLHQRCALRSAGARIGTCAQSNPCVGRFGN
jgi:hypothetical protein